MKASTRQQPSQQRPHQQRPHQQQQKQPTWEDNRPIRPSKLDGDSQSHFVTGYDRKRNPLASLASGNTPRREDLNGSNNYNDDALDREVSSKKYTTTKKWKPPAEHFSFTPGESNREGIAIVGEGQ